MRMCIILINIILSKTDPKYMKKLLYLILCLPSIALAAPLEFSLIIQDHKFQPAELHVPQGERVKLIVDNKDGTPEEFESYELNREKVIPGNSRTVIFVGPLKPGKYPFFGEFNADSAQGVLVAE